ncbi:MAG: hypothetical protein OEX22_10610 [Cyclobacteriaceae bacterium]|nr:hypothetical protein [Cyclobacteriaceae bacterium]
MKKLATFLMAVVVYTTAFAQDSFDKNDSKSTEVKNKKEKKNRGTTHDLNFDFGINNYLQNGKSPENTNEIYSAKPLGSWAFAINGINRTHIAGPLYLQWGGGINWYNFKFHDETVRMSKDNNNVIFTNDTRVDIDPIKSKLTSTYLNASMLPVFQFGGKSKNWDNDWCFGHNKGNGFRIGVGGYAGYKINSYSKFVYEDKGDKRKEKDKDGYYLNNWRYGARLQLGFRDVDLFVNYDISELFVKDKGPQLNTFSFGITI